ncbi:carbohydrate kinase [Mesorhizobium sp. M7A.F.Ca.CA.001.07.2.1]|uniref:FGGY-family carbohydrate kinase n=3 Tax=Phyllobacteriaceae TaxID=69277 RepID=UPI000FCCA5A4|nr:MULTISPECIES: FGGY-family carbohydrate kinase [Mesorhizobium]MCF6127939.1 carbohydrate kinase [Mesorhizobium ciceri]MCQ8818546.1 carbohydrate kinase [Mesorhizobium sp. SEMIA396]RUX76384.1 carbohydrate kinase [Mesorhizobium sp. M7A.F.Ca.CA.004.08.2.1]RUX83717.1 carbohydrate kinase [Mesorhizobium sp. M7A.F.Ca.CA.004.08.1.1]RUY22261.1 carbohydrate kinase [Mesorhizobium sp. M7A.F.Ca.CA.004.12.1.1]
MASYILGLDAGNTVIKAILFDLSGRELAFAARDGRSSMPKPGHVERDLDELWRNAVSVIGQCIAEAGIDAGEIVAIGCAGHGNGLYALDRTGAPLIGIQSLDTRAVDIVAEWAKQNVGGRTYAHCLQRPWAAQTPTLLAWLKRFSPALFASIGTVFLCKDFVVNRLTGARSSDTSDMSGCGLLQMQDRRYEPDLLAAYGLGDCMDLLPPVLESADIAGHVSAEVAALTGLRAGTPVVAGLFDVVASAVGSGVTRTGAASVIAGTWSINQVITDEPIRDPSIFMLSTFDRQRYLAIESSATSAANLEWIVREFLEHGGEAGKSPFELCSELVASVDPNSDIPIYHPFLYGSQQNGHARAGFYGIAGWHSRAHLLRALFEGVAFEHKRHVETLHRAGADFDQVVLSGGGSRSSVWPQIFADVLGVPVTVARSRETGALGAAIAAGTGVGIFADYSAGAAAMTAAARHFVPNEAVADAYAGRYRLYGEINQAMTPMWERIAGQQART